MVLVLLLWCAGCRLICGGGCRVKCHVLDMVHCVHVLDNLYWCLLISSIHASPHPESPLPPFFRFLPQHVLKGVPASSLPVQMQERTCLSPPELSNGSICHLDGLCRQDKDEVCLECCPIEAPAARDMPATDMSLTITTVVATKNTEEAAAATTAETAPDAPSTNEPAPAKQVEGKNKFDKALYNISSAAPGWRQYFLPPFGPNDRSYFYHPDCSNTQWMPPDNWHKAPIVSFSFAAFPCVLCFFIVVRRRLIINAHDVAQEQCVSILIMQHFVCKTKDPNGLWKKYLQVCVRAIVHRCVRGCTSVHTYRHKHTQTHTHTHKHTHTHSQTHTYTHAHTCKRTHTHTYTYTHTHTHT